jgi:phosphoribosyl 1,2-cyclic phosphodiesterase
MPASSESITRLKFWGVRGSIPVPGASTLRHGGNTTCAEFRSNGELIVLDAGSGIRELGVALEKEFGSDPIKMHLLLTHLHWDHIQGFPFFLPAYNDKNEIQIFGYDSANVGLHEILKGQMAAPFFPVALYDLPGKIDIQKLEKMEFNIGKVRVRSRFMNHPGVCVGYRLDTADGSMAFLPDSEPYDAFKLHSSRSDLLSPEQIQKRANTERAALVEFLTGCDLLVLDAQYTDDEYHSHIGWGHGSLSGCVALAMDAKVKKLVLFHHDPNHDDAMLDEMLKQTQALAAKAGTSLEVVSAREGDEFVLDRS